MPLGSFININICSGYGSPALRRGAEGGRSCHQHLNIYIHAEFSLSLFSVFLSIRVCDQIKGGIRIRVHRILTFQQM